MEHILLSFVFYNIILIIFYNHYRRGHKYITKSSLFFYTILLIAFGTYGGGEGDYLHYKESVEEFHTLFDVMYYNGMEIQYNYLAYVVGANYDLWRLVIFSIQFIGMSWLLSKVKLNTYPVFLCFITICLVLYTYQRAYWGVIFYFMGLYLLLEKKNPLFLIIIALCYVSHTQNIVLLALLPLAFVNFRKWQLFLVFLLIGVLATILKDYFTAYLDSGGVEGAEYLNDKAQRYSEGGLGNFGNSIGEYIMFIFRYVPLAVIVLTCLKMIFSNRDRYLAFYKPFRGIVNITIGLTIASLVVLFADLGAGTFFYRIISMTLFPVSLLLPYMVENRIVKKQSFNRYIWIYISVAEMGYMKDIYYAYANGVAW